MPACAAGKDGKAQAPWSPSQLNEETGTQLTLSFVLISTSSAPASPSRKWKKKNFSLGHILVFK